MFITYTGKTESPRDDLPTSEGLSMQHRFFRNSAPPRSANSSSARDDSCAPVSLHSPCPPLSRYLSSLLPLLFPLLLLLPACTLITDYLARSGEVIVDDPSSGALIWSDEFEGASLDTTKWSYRALGPRRDAVNVREAISLDGQGHLLMTTSRVGEEVHTGMIATHNTFMHRYGYWEARMSFQEEEGHWSAFWIQSPTVGEVGDPGLNGVEIDVIEWMTNKRFLVLHNLHWNGYGDEHKSKGKRVPFGGLSEGFHTVAVDWTPDSYTFYVDGQQTWQTNEAVSHRDQYAILSLEVGDWAGDIARATLPDTLVVDYVRVYDRKP